MTEKMDSKWLSLATVSILGQTPKVSEFNANSGGRQGVQCFETRYKHLRRYACCTSHSIRYQCATFAPWVRTRALLKVQSYPSARCFPATLAGPGIAILGKSARWDEDPLDLHLYPSRPW